LEADGFVVGRNLRIEYRWAEFKYQRLPDLSGRKVSVIAAVGSAHSGLASKARTSVVPIVFVSAGDTIAFGLVGSLNRPNGNVTGISMITVALAPKRLQLPHELVPAPAGMAMLANSSSPYFEREKMDVMASARALGRKLHVFTTSNAMEIETAVSSLRDEIGALLISGDPYFDGERDRLVALAARYSMPTVYQWREFATIGGLMSHGTSILDAYQQAETYVAKILNGDKTADLPVLQPTRLEWVINLTTAAALGLTVPAILLASADEIIE
jgi:putative ABC transport system substrate-binding protein